MKVLLLTDREHWAYHAIAKSLMKYNINSNISLKIMHIKGEERDIKRKYKKFDRVLIMGWQTYDRVSFIDKSITMVGLHSFHSWDCKKTTPEKDVKPPRKLIKHLNSFLKVNAVSERLTNLFRKHGVKNITYTPNGVDTEIFKVIKTTPVGSKFIIGYSGSKAHDWRKGVSEFIIPSAKKAGAKVKIAMLSTNKHLPLEEMYKFYNEIDCYICASSSEGMSLSVLEAAACGRPVVTTRCSGNTEVIKEGKTGFFVNRNVSEIAGKINILKNDHNMLKNMSNAIREDIRCNWCWSKRTKAWVDFISS